MNMAESFVNLSMSKKNRREIAGSGIAMYLDKIFVYGNPEAKSHVLRMIGNLLSSNLFHDRISREDTLSSLLNNLLDPKVQDQFSGVAYCLAQVTLLLPFITLPHHYCHLPHYYPITTITPLLSYHYPNPTTTI